jgi:hypothetical protein
MPPRALISSAASRMPASPGAPIEARPPDSLKTAPIRIGSAGEDAQFPPPSVKTSTAARRGAHLGCKGFLARLACVWPASSYREKPANSAHFRSTTYAPRSSMSRMTTGTTSRLPVLGSMSISPVTPA